MASFTWFLLLSLLLHSILNVHCNDEEDNLVQGLNQYRASLNLTSLTKNDGANCLTGEIAVISSRVNLVPTNSTGSNTVPGTEPRFSNYPTLLTKCHLNVTTTRDGQILPACIPNLEPTLVLSNFTKSQYSADLDDTPFTGIGVGSNDNWIVVILTTSTPEGSYELGSNLNSAVTSLTAAGHMVLLLVGILMMLYG